MRKALRRYSFYTLILAVYGVFFSVQTFYNFEGHSDAREILQHARLLHSASPHSGLKTANLSFPGSQKAKARLNKRFHLEEFPPCTVYEVSAPFVPAIPRALGFLVEKPLPPIAIDHPLLRGPPAFA